MYQMARIEATARAITSPIALKVCLLIFHLNFQGSLKKNETPRAKRRSKMYEKEIVDGSLCHGRPHENPK
jgi:hypothetical protein